MNAKQYLICLRCNREDCVIKPDAIFEQVFKGETLKVESPGMICQHCGYDVQLTPRTRDGGVKTGFDFSFTNQVVQGNLRKELFFFHVARVS